ncbi:MAG: lambda family phage portal protein [Maricaulis maris]|jgi:lambda family phage portal protein|tara:strand:+ start:163 stop:1677 length:1515 start_codon:yes stop_codon:yes gene_type:complete
MGWLTHLIGQVAPEAALRRARAQAALGHAMRSFEAASTGRRNKYRKGRGTSANAENTAAAATLRNRSRESQRNDPYAKRALEIWTESASGIVPTPATGSDRLDRQLREAFEEFSEHADSDGQGDWLALQDLAIHTLLESGDVLQRRRRRRSSDGLGIPLQIQLLEPDHLDGTRLRNGSNDIVGGIELDLLNRRQAYWLFPHHPGENRILHGQSLTSTRVGADQVAHSYRRTRPGQLLGVPLLHAVLQDLGDLDDLEQASLMQQKIANCFGAFVRRSDVTNNREVGLDELDDDEGELERFEPGMIEYLEPGEDISFATPPSTAGHPEYIRSRLHRIASGASMPYMLLTGDVSQANWSSYKAGFVPFKQAIRRFQRRTVLPTLCRPQYRWFVESAFAAGRIDALDYGVSWTLPGFEPIDRLKEAMADKMEARIGKRSINEAIRADGRNPEAVIAEFATWFAEVDEAEMVFDSDPRKVSDAGLTQAAVSGQSGSASTPASIDETDEE